jgi:hypothetical protein
MQFLRCHTSLPATTDASIAAVWVSFGNCRWLSTVRATKIAALASVLTKKKSRVPRLVIGGPIPWEAAARDG